MNKRQRKKQLKKKLGYNPPVNKIMKELGIALGESCIEYYENMMK